MWHFIEINANAERICFLLRLHHKLRSAIFQKQFHADLAFLLVSIFGGLPENASQVLRAAQSKCWINFYHGTGSIVLIAEADVARTRSFTSFVAAIRRGVRQKSSEPQDLA